jgi:spermidine synthase
MSASLPEIAIENSRNGRRILRKQGRLLASAIDPLKEAETWALRALAQVQLGDSLVILGLGCGYHVEALLKMRPGQSILVIEHDERVAQHAYDFCPSIPRFDVVVATDWTRLADAGRVRDVLTGVFKILAHPSSVLADREYYARVESFFRGRDRASFFMQLRLRPELVALIDAEKVEAMPDEAVSIKSIQNLFQDTSVPSKELHLWKVLEELVR